MSAAARVTIDTSQVGRFAADLTRRGPLAQLRAYRLVREAGERCRDDARKRAPRGPHLPHYASSITATYSETGDGPESVVGPDRGKPQGPLGGLLELGTATSGPHPHLRPAATAAGAWLATELARGIW